MALLHRREEADIKTRQLGVLFEDLQVVGLGASASFQQTLGSIFNPMNLVHKIQSIRRPPLRNILTDFEGVVRPGEMLCVFLLLGSPFSSLTSILLQWFWGAQAQVARHCSKFFPTGVQNIIPYPETSTMTPSPRPKSNVTTVVTSSTVQRTTSFSPPSPSTKPSILLPKLARLDLGSKGKAGNSLQGSSRISTQLSLD